uniref:Putative transmembrane protein n=1 Tax=Toxoplasma gondii COUG TaxID=1074873 RepID=A0A2G8YBW8_TOXGO|nr:putative transmembrane protein [Toxoplasma gondii COUG]
MSRPMVRIVSSLSSMFHQENGQFPPLTRCQLFRWPGGALALAVVHGGNCACSRSLATLSALDFGSRRHAVPHKKTAACERGGAPLKTQDSAKRLRVQYSYRLLALIVPFLSVAALP